MPYLAIALGGAAGALARYLVDTWVSTRTGSSFPWGTLVVNLTGAFVLGLLATLAVERALLPSSIRAPVLIGFLGAYTTFSTWMLDSWRLLEEGSWVAAAGNIAGSVALGLVAVGAGIAIGRMVP
jgi:fluoride exporter